MSEWLKLKLRDIIVLNYGKALKTQDRKDGNIPVFSSAGLTGYHNQALIEKEGIIVGRKGTIGKIYISNSPFWCIDTAYYILPNPEKYDFLFIFYLLQTLGLEELNEDSAVPGLNRNTVYNQCFTLPPLPEQKAIASILSSIDDKIDLLHRQNKTLESMAETLFRQWFIEDNQELWEEKSLSEIAVFTNGLACQKYPASVDEKGLPVLKIKELQSGFSNTTDIASSKVNSEYIVHHGDIIFAWSASLMVKIWSGPDCVLNQHLFNVKSDKYPKWFYYEWCKYHLKEFINISQSHATTMGHIRRKDLDEAIVKVPPDKELSLMSKEMIPILNQRIEKMKQILTLENLRDTLLPKLMSAEVRVKLD